MSDIIKEQADYSGVTLWHDAGITGKGANIWNAEPFEREHGQISHRRVTDAAPGANVITAGFSLSYDSEKVKSNSVEYEGQKYSIDEFIAKYKIKIVTVSKSGSNKIGSPLSDFWGNLQKKYNLIIFCAIDNDGTEKWGGCIPYDVAIYVGAASLYKGKPRRDGYSSVSPELDFMQFTGLWSGTSFSTPYLAGMAALLVQIKPDITQGEIYKYFENHAEDMQEAGLDDYTGHGLARLGSVGEDLGGGESDIMNFYFHSLPTPNLRITSRFGKRNTGISGASTYHQGIDLGGLPSGNTPIYAVRRGVVVKNYWNDVRGWVLVIKHSDKYETLYQHLKSRSTRQIGEEVTAGQQIGIMGNTSTRLSIATHLHFELHENGTPIDPEPYLLNVKGVEFDMTEKELREIVRAEIKKTLNGEDAEPSSWAESAWEKAQAAGITDGTRPQGYTTREQVITMIARTIKD